MAKREKVPAPEVSGPANQVTALYAEIPVELKEQVARQAMSEDRPLRMVIADAIRLYLDSKAEHPPVI